MVRSLLSTRHVLVGATAFMLTGCPDPQGRVDDFVERTTYEKAPGKCVSRPPPSGVPPVTRADPSGRWLLALASAIGKDKPLIFEAEIAVDTSVEPWLMDIEIFPINITDFSRTEPTSKQTGVEIDAFGVFEIDFDGGLVTINGEADPIIPGAEIVTTLILNGATGSLDADGTTGPTGPAQEARSVAAGTEVFCGTFGGNIEQPAQVPLAGSVFGAKRMADGEVIEANFDWIGECPQPAADENAFVCEP